MASSSDMRLARRFARAAAQRLIQRFGAAEARRRLLRRAATEDADGRRLFIEVIMAIDALTAEASKDD